MSNPAKFTIIIHYRDATNAMAPPREIRLKDLDKATVNTRWPNICQHGIKYQVGPTMWEVIPPFRITQIFIEQQPE